MTCVFYKFPTKAVHVTGLKKSAVDLTSQEALHAVTVGHLEEATARVCGQSRVGTVGEQDSHYIKVVVFHSIVNGSETIHMNINFDADSVGKNIDKVSRPQTVKAALSCGN